MSILDELKAATHAEHEADGLVYRIRKVTSRDLLAVKARHLAATMARREGEEYAPETDPEAIAAEERMKLEEIDRFVQACVVAVRRSDAPDWEPVRIVANEADEDHGAVPPRMWVETLPIRVRVGIAAAGYSLTMTAEGAQIIDSFRGGSVAPAAGGSAGKAVQLPAP